METLDVSTTQLSQPEFEGITDIWPSEVGTIMGLSPYQTPLELWQIKTGRKARPNLDEIEAVQMGVLLEDVIAKRFAEKQKVKIRRVNETLVHPDYPWWRGKIDRQIVGGSQREFLECKNCSEYQRDKWGPEGSDIVPDYYALQVHAYMPLRAGFDVGHMAALIGGNRHRCYRIERDDTILALIEARLIEFRQCLIDDRVPVPQTVSDLEMLWPNHSKDVAMATEDVLRDISQLQQVNDSIRELNEAKEELSSRLKLFMGEQGFLGADDEILATYKTQQQTRVDTKRLKAEFPDVFTACQVSKSIRVLRIK